MKHRPDISVHKNQKLINYVKEKVLSDLNGTFQSGSIEDFNNDLQLHNDLIKNDQVKPIKFIPKGKTKSKPNLNIQKRNLDAINTHRTDMMRYANREYAIFADLLIEYSTYYVLTITSYKLLFKNETPTAKDFDIYCDGLLVDKTTYDVKVTENVVITIQKSEAVDDHFDETNFEIVSKWDWTNVSLGDINGDGFEDWLDTENYEDIIA